MRPAKSQSAAKIVYPVTTATVGTIFSFIVIHLGISDHSKIALMAYASPVALVLNLLVLWGEPKLYYRNLATKIENDKRLLETAKLTRDEAVASPHYSKEFKDSTVRTCEMMTQTHMNDLAELQSRSREVRFLAIFQDLLTKTKDE